MQPRTIVFGATGFVGGHLLGQMDKLSTVPVTRSTKELPEPMRAGWAWREADLLDADAIVRLLEKGDTVINLVYSANASPEENMAMTRNLVQACRSMRVTKLIHCSTAIVIGDHPALEVDESTQCRPVTPYERIKFQIETEILGAACADLQVFVLRPTSVVGAGGQNLNKLLHGLRFGSKIINAVRSSLFGSRRMNLVPVGEVVGALLHLRELPAVKSGIFICAADDDADNRFDRVEALIKESLRTSSLARVPHLPGFCLRIVLWFARSGSGRIPNRRYSSNKLIATGYKRHEDIAHAVREFVRIEVERQQ